MKINARVDVDEVVTLTAAVLRQLPYATNKAITRVAKLAVDAGQHEMAADLQIRKRFILQRLKILQYSTVNNLTAVVGIDPRVQGSPLILGFLETGGEKIATKGPELAIPLTGEAPRPTFPQSIRPAYLYPNLQFQNRRGRQRTFIVPGVGIFQRVQSYAGRVLRSLGRTGEGLDNTVLIYAFKPSAKLPPHMQLRRAMIAVIGERFSPIFTQEFVAEILAHARR